MSPFKINFFTLLKLPSAWFTGVRAKEINSKLCKVSVRKSWINQNPFNSIFWAIQGMAAELSTGALLMYYIKKSGRKISMLVLNNKGSFLKKAKGRVTFKCNQGEEVEKIVSLAIQKSKPQKIIMNSFGLDSNGQKVSEFEFEWTILVKK
jgi:hypothetical protein